MSPTRSRNKAILLVLFVLGLALRLWGLHSQSLSHDEVLELQIFRSPIGEILTVGDGFPPLYHLAAAGWLQIFPEDSSIRYFSVVLGMLAIAVMVPLARSTGLNTGSWATLALAISPYHIWYSQEGRAQILVFLFAALALLFLFRSLESQDRAAWLLFSVVSLAGLYTHYYFVFFLVSAAAVVVMRRRRVQMWRALQAFGVVALLALPLAWLLRADIALQRSMSSQTPFDLAALGYSLFTYVVGYSLGPSPREIHALEPGQAIVGFLPWLIVLAACAAVIVFFCVRERLGVQAGRIRELLVLAVVPVLLCGLADAVFHVGFKTHYAVFAAIPTLLLLSYGVSRSAHAWLGRLAILLVSSMMLLSIYNRYSEPQYQNVDMRGVAEFLLDQNPNKTSPVFVVAGYMTVPLHYYLDGDWALHPLPPILGDTKRLEEVLTFIRERQVPGSSCWVVYTRAFHGDAHQLLRRALLEEPGFRREVELAGVEIFGGRGATPATLTPEL